RRRDHSRPRAADVVRRAMARRHGVRDGVHSRGLQGARNETMSVRLHFNGQVCDAEPGLSLFTVAEKLGVQVPTSCNKQGKCKECVVEVTEGMERLSKPGPEEKHLK